MPTAINKVVYGNNTLLDLTRDMALPEYVMQGVTFHDASGQARTGTASPLPPNVETSVIVPSENTNGIEVPYDENRSVICALIIDTTRGSGQNYTQTSVYGYVYEGSGSTVKYGTILNYQAAPAGNASYGAFTVDTTNHKIIFGVNDNRYYYRANHVYGVMIVYENPVYPVTRNISGGAMFSNESVGVMHGQPYIGEIAVPDEHFTLGNVSISMGGVDVTATAYNPISKMISIPKVTGAIVVNATATNDYFAAICDLTAFEQYASNKPCRAMPFDGNGVGIITEYTGSGLKVRIPIHGSITSGMNIYLKADSVEVGPGADASWAVRAYFYDANGTQLGSNTDFITGSSSNKNISQLADGVRGWIGNASAGATQVELRFYTFNDISVPVGVLLHNIRLQTENPSP